MPSPAEIAAACRLLFGASVTVTPDFLAGLNPGDLRTTFRRRALELHPDRAGILGRDPSLLDEMFKEVKRAYDTLSDLVDLKDPGAGIPSPAESPAERTVGFESGSGEHYWQAGVPQRPLLFGQFLYYTGLISWRMLIDAVVWQRNQRPAFGRIATLWNYCDRREVTEILAHRRPGERFGDAATRLGYLTHFQKRTVVGMQKWLQPPIGGYFQDVGLLEEEEIVYLVRLMKKHNRKQGPGSGRP